jgi:hypothetical protein
MSMAPGPEALHGWRANAYGGSGCARRRARQVLRQDHHRGALRLAAVHRRPELRGTGSCPGGQRGRWRRGHEKAGQCADLQGDARHRLAASQGRLDLQGGRIAVRGHQRQNLAAGHRYRPVRRGVTSARPARKDRCAGPSGDHQEQAGDLARASPPAGRGRRLVRKVRRPSEHMASHPRPTGVGPGPIASSGPHRRLGRGAPEAGSACRSSARAGHGNREAVGSACRSSVRPPHRGFVALGLGWAQTVGLVARRVARYLSPLLVGREPSAPSQVPEPSTLALMARRPWLAA